jgi:vacuolar-type H+-ATPase subunit D/Vma8
MSQRSLSIVSLCCVAVIASAWLARTPSHAADDEKAELNKQIHALLEQRRDTLKERFEVVTALHQKGINSSQDIAQAAEELLQAKLALATDRDERIAIAKERVENFRRGEAVVESLFARAEASRSQKLKATATRQQAEIDLLREQLGK